VTDTIEPVPVQIDQQQLADQLVAQAREEGVQLVGEGGPLTGLTNAVVETATPCQTVMPCRASSGVHPQGRLQAVGSR
jgi:hypothetical protein